jgi:class 3 adenylate cyclase/tetratricopeptide (TPR) repeat protein
LTADDLIGLGVTSIGHRRKLLDAIADLRDHHLPKAAWHEGDTGVGRRQLTLMFCDLVGSTELSRRLDPEVLRDVIGSYHRLCTEVITKSGGFVGRYLGDGVLAYFGYPQAHEDDAERSVHAGLSLVGAVTKLDVGTGTVLQVRVGIATGLVVVGDLIGEGAARETGVVGETPNLAARLQSLAEPNTVVIDGNTHHLLGGLFEYHALGKVPVKGFGDPVPVWQVIGLSSVNSRFEALRAATTPLIGRGNEIDLLMHRWQRAKTGDGCIVLVSGEAGIGKSRIALAFARSIAAEPHMRLSYQCSPHHINSALHPFTEQLKRAAGFDPGDTAVQQLAKLEAMLALGTSRVEPVVPLFAALLSISLGDRYPVLALSPAQQRRQTFAALLDQMEGLACKQPILCIFEDVHWADATSLELLDLAVERVRHLPVLLLITFRPEYQAPWAGRPNVSMLGLGRLDLHQVQIMVEQMTAGRRLPDEVMRQIIVKTDGVPLFVEELTKTVLEADILVEDADRYRLKGPLAPLAIPATLRDSLMARLDRLASAKEIAQIGSAIGREFSFPLLHALANRELKDALNQLEVAGLLFRHGESSDAIYSFKHALVQDAAYDSMLKTRRQTLHRRIAETLRDKFPKNADTEPEVVAHHFTQADLPEAAVEWWSKAGQLALKRSAYSEAIAHLGKAVAIADELPDQPGGRHINRLHLQVAFGRAVRGGLGYSAPEAVAAWGRARELAADIKDPAELAPIHSGLFNASLTHGELKPMREVADLIMAAAQQDPKSSVAGVVAHWTSGLTWWFQGNYLTAKTHLEQALAIFHSEQSPEIFRSLTLDLPAAVIRFLGLVLWPLGEINRSHRFIDEAVSGLEIRRPLVQANELVHKIVFDGLCRHHHHMMEQSERILVLAREHALPLYVAAGTYLNGLANWCTGNRQAGLAGMRQGWVLLHENDCYLYEPFWGLHVAEAEAGMGQIERGLTTLSELIVWSKQTGQHWLDAELFRVRGELLRCIDPSDVAAAEDAFKQAVDVARSQQTKTFELRAALGLARLYVAQDRASAVIEILGPILSAFDKEERLLEIKEGETLLMSLGEGRVVAQSRAVSSTFGP